MSAALRRILGRLLAIATMGLIDAAPGQVIPRLVECFSPQVPAR